MAELHDVRVMSALMSMSVAHFVSGMTSQSFKKLQTHRKLQRTLQYTARKISAYKVFVACRTWVTCTRQARTAKMALMTMSRSSAMRIFRHWQEQLAVAGNSRHSMTRAISLMTNVKLKAGLTAWRSGAEKRRDIMYNMRIVFWNTALCAFKQKAAMKGTFRQLRSACVLLLAQRCIRIWQLNRKDWCFSCMYDERKQLQGALSLVKSEVETLTHDMAEELKDLRVRCSSAEVVCETQDDEILLNWHQRKMKAVRWLGLQLDRRVKHYGRSCLAVWAENIRHMRHRADTWSNQLEVVRKSKVKEKALKEESKKKAQAQEKLTAFLIKDQKRSAAVAAIRSISGRMGSRAKLDAVKHWFAHSLVYKQTTQLGEQAEEARHLVYKQTRELNAKREAMNAIRRALRSISQQPTKLGILTWVVNLRQSKASSAQKQADALATFGRGLRVTVQRQTVFSLMQWNLNMIEFTTQEEVRQFYRKKMKSKDKVVIIRDLGRILRLRAKRATHRSIRNWQMNLTEFKTNQDLRPFYRKKMKQKDRLNEIHKLNRNVRNQYSADVILYLRCWQLNVDGAKCADKAQRSTTDRLKAFYKKKLKDRDDELDRLKRGDAA